MCIILNDNELKKWQFPDDLLNSLGTNFILRQLSFSFFSRKNYAYMSIQSKEEILSFLKSLFVFFYFFIRLILSKLKISWINKISLALCNIWICLNHFQIPNMILSDDMAYVLLTISNFLINIAFASLSSIVPSKSFLSNPEFVCISWKRARTKWWLRLR